MSNAHRSLCIWPVLIDAALRHRTLTYTELKELIGFNGLPNWQSDSLGRIASFCHRNGLPILPAIVINRFGGPGPGLPFVDDHLAERVRVFDFAWATLRPVTVEDFQERACLAGM